MIHQVQETEASNVQADTMSSAPLIVAEFIFQKGILYAEITASS